MQNDLKQPETTWNKLQRARNNLKQPETTYNDREKTWNNINNLKRPTRSKKQHTMTWNIYYNKQTKKPKSTYNKQILKLFCNISSLLSSLTSFLPNIWLQSFEHCFMENHDENRAPIYILSCVFMSYLCILGYIMNHLDICKLIFARQKPTLWIELDIRIKFWHWVCLLPIILTSTNHWMSTMHCLRNWTKKFLNLSSLKLVLNFM